jgi:hypothetical protein
MLHNYKNRVMKLLLNKKTASLLGSSFINKFKIILIPKPSPTFPPAS